MTHGVVQVELYESYSYLQFKFDIIHLYKTNHFKKQKYLRILDKSQVPDVKLMNISNFKFGLCAKTQAANKRGYESVNRAMGYVSYINGSWKQLFSHTQPAAQ